MAHKSASQYQSDLPQFSTTHLITLLICCPGRMTICLKLNSAVFTEQLVFFLWCYFLLCYFLLSLAVRSKILPISKTSIFNTYFYCLLFVPSSAGIFPAFQNLLLWWVQFNKSNKFRQYPCPSWSTTSIFFLSYSLFLSFCTSDELNDTNTSYSQDLLHLDIVR